MTDEDIRRWQALARREMAAARAAGWYEKTWAGAPSEHTAAILDVLADGKPRRRIEILGFINGAVAAALQRLRATGQIETVGRGIYRIGKQ